MKKILIFLIFVLVSTFSFSQTTIAPNFSKTFYVTEWYEVESDHLTQSWLTQSDNILNKPIKVNLKYNTNHQAIITLITDGGNGDITIKNASITKAPADGGTVWLIWMKVKSIKRVVFRFEELNNKNTSLIEITKYY